MGEHVTFSEPPTSPGRPASASDQAEAALRELVRLLARIAASEALATAAPVDDTTENRNDSREAG